MEICTEVSEINDEINEVKCGLLRDLPKKKRACTPFKRLNLCIEKHTIQADARGKCSLQGVW